MIQVSLVVVLTDESVRGSSFFDDLLRYYSTLEDMFKKFEIVCVTGCSDYKFNNDLHIFCSGHNNCVVLKSDKPSVKRCIQIALGSAVYDYVILLNTDVGIKHTNLDYALVKNTLYGNTVSCALLDTNNKELRNQSGVVFKNFYLMSALDYINAKSVSEFCLQINRLFFHIGKSYRANGDISHFEIYDVTIPISGFAKLRMHIFLSKYKKAYPYLVFRVSQKGLVAYD